MYVPRKEHPKPQMMRTNWENLNGLWDFAFDFSDSGVDKEYYKCDDIYTHEVLHCTRKTTLIQLLMELLPSIIEMPSEMQFHHCRKEIRAVLSYLQYHYTENLTLDDIATMANLDRSYLCRLFKKEMGMSIFQYINEIRMKKAAELITNENTYIREVALAVGIEDQYYFARLFKKHFGVSPTEYRETTE